MTFIQFQQRLQRMLNTSGADATMLAFIQDCINQAYFEISREGAWPELRKSISITPLANTSTGLPETLPADYSREYRVRYNATPLDLSGPAVTYQLRERQDIIPPSPYYGKPSYYFIVSGGYPSQIYSIQIEPFGANAYGDTLMIDYISAPPMMIVDNDAPLSINWDEEIIKKAESIYYLFFNKLEQSQALFARSKTAMVAAASTPTAPAQ